MQLPESRILFDQSTISDAVDELAKHVNVKCSEGSWLMLSVLTGGLVLAADLMRRLQISMELDLIRVSRYHNKTRGAELTWQLEPSASLQNARVLLVDDIFDEGETLAALDRYCVSRGAQQVLSVVLLDKIHNRKVKHYKPDLIGLTCSDEYVFGYGMDYEGFFRNLPEIRSLGS
ncbi:MAG: hypoxanthine-guanine phosphoribosyltransferase [bacterium]|nr:hypoxanthine-guanine phosphoribosyltransferase [Gammaproteobacteria bacterium]HIL97509.1 hypoxanthine-guanine phosphoribosyltransferase [Pseudomonadales bacterium]